MGSFLDKAMDATIAPGFSRLGYLFRRRSWDPIEASLGGRVMVITGATSGIGKAAAAELARLGAQVVLVGRNPDKTAQVREELVASTGNTTLRTQIADLSLMTEVRDLASRLLEEEPSIHVLINNAGTLFPERGITSEGIERTLATDLLGHFLLTNLLIPRLAESAPARIVNVSSGGMYGQRMSVSNLQSDQGEYKGAAAYARAKRGQVILSEIWAERLAAQGVTVNAMHPGWADTPGVEESLPRFHRITRPFLRSPAQGADTLVWLAASAEVEGATGLFWHDRRPRPTHRTKRTEEQPEARQALWDELERLSG